MREINRFFGTRASDGTGLLVTEYVDGSCEIVWKTRTLILAKGEARYRNDVLDVYRAPIVDRR